MAARQPLPNTPPSPPLVQTQGLTLYGLPPIPLGRPLLAASTTSARACVLLLAFWRVRCQNCFWAWSISAAHVEKTETSIFKFSILALFSTKPNHAHDVSVCKQLPPPTSRVAALYL